MKPRDVLDHKQLHRYARFGDFDWLIAIMTANLHSDHEGFGGLAASTYNSSIYTPPASGGTIHRVPSLLKGQCYGAPVEIPGTFQIY